MILCCGEALVDFLPRADAGGGTGFAPAAGGSVHNVAVALGRLGVPVGFFGGLSSDRFGALLRDGLVGSGVDISLAVVSDRPSTLAFLGIDGGDASYAFFDESSAGRMLTAEDLPALPATLTAFHFGSFSLAVEPCGSAFEALMARECGRRPVSLDPNVRPALVGDAGAYRARLERAIAMADIVKLSQDDLDWIAPGADFPTIAGRWLGRGAKLVVLTRGAGEITAVTRDGSVAVPAVAAEIADTVGAGDTFSAGILAHLAERDLLDKERIAALSGDQLADMLRFAARAAAVTVSRPGADPPWRREVA